MKVIRCVVRVILKILVFRRRKGFLEGEEGSSNNNIQEKKFKERDKERRSQV